MLDEVLSGAKGVSSSSFTVSFSIRDAPLNSVSHAGFACLQASDHGESDDWTQSVGNGQEFRDSHLFAILNTTNFAQAGQFHRRRSGRHEHQSKP